jgi:hypothetical protein
MPKLSIPGYTFRKHWFYFPDGVQWFCVDDMTTGQHAEYIDESDTIRFIREPIVVKAGEEPKERIIEERSFPSATRQFERFRILVSEWSLVDPQNNAAPINREAWNELPPGWAQHADKMIILANPELIGESRTDRDAKIAGEVERPEPGAKKQKVAPAT